MADLQQLRVQEAVDSMVKTLEKENIRKMQVASRRLKEHGQAEGPERVIVLCLLNGQVIRAQFFAAFMFRCSASCCEDNKASMQQVHQCIERCHSPLAQAQALVTRELEKFQDRLARCTMHCNDKAKDSIDAGNKELQVKRQLESCVTKCVDDHMNLIPSMTKKMKESLSSIQI